MDVPADAVCSLLCEAAGLDSDGEPLEYRYELGRGERGLVWAHCSFDGESGPEAGHGLETCMKAASRPCELGVRGPTDGGYIERRVTFTVGPEGIIIDGMKTAAGTTTFWSDLLSYEDCRGTPPL